MKCKEVIIDGIWSIISLYHAHEKRLTDDERLDRRRFYLCLLILRGKHNYKLTRCVTHKPEKEAA